MAGYRRYANRRTYNQMVKNNELWDWGAGQKLPEIEEDNELESIEEEDDDEDSDEDDNVRLLPRVQDYNATNSISSLSSSVALASPPQAKSYLVLLALRLALLHGLHRQHSLPQQHQLPTTTCCVDELEFVVTSSPDFIPLAYCEETPKSYFLKRCQAANL